MFPYTIYSKRSKLIYAPTHAGVEVCIRSDILSVHHTPPHPNQPIETKTKLYVASHLSDAFGVQSGLLTPHGGLSQTPIPPNYSFLQRKLRAIRSLA